MVFSEGAGGLIVARRSRDEVARWFAQVQAPTWRLRTVPLRHGREPSAGHRGAGFGCKARWRASASASAWRCESGRSGGESI